MIPAEWKRDLLQLIELLFVKQDDLFEGPLDVVGNILTRYPEEVSLFVDLFEQDKYPNDADRETLALIILPHLAYPGVIGFLHEHTGWTDDEINEIAGKKVL
ncbi:MAG: hypothetical protein COS82_09130 [Zetaproteobacteria bacterium CG06_land_8_20_14_3_00_59_53]|nr:MAG: hypothetical protein AUK36_11445 [Zetaproteobacteria bacterium CG2_30_59_37]PIO89975.1 MAG: hypothetical protein COX56_05050 [Zetaproteobacteria bacterium CG23_combo_of_CG06-09_8_20_14_all_59_86]PIQ64082.1 MAG: hypothetical protein COV97_11175 [Zetaproteobacteria bacterium CG11_big_fil_rev_8_21_14_0_20_59_439]PIU69906.1 MAG: hypothetical protein COS82_09130 [Zetaproteobacteria bacterium CG06_land_8_20_14_3_00_59_53]PIU97580.1 MAG: hypothetical protein COS62_03045 [Zetaproteobacteria bac